MAQPTLPQFFSPGFPQLLDTLLGAQIRRVDSILQNSLRCCEFDDEFGCGAVATITHLDSERELCPKHFRLIEIEDQLAELSA